MAYRLSLKSRILMRDHQSVNECAPRSFQPKHHKQPVSLVRCVYPSGRLAYKVNEDLADCMHREGLADAVRSRKGRILCLRLKASSDHIPGGVSYVSDAPAHDNPANVWKLLKITDLPRSIFMQVQTDCITGAR